MGPARLILLALCGWADGPDPAALVTDLSSPREAVREEAAGALEELGRPALPALYRARDSDDPGLRRRVEQVVDQIERQRLLRATRVRLDFDDTPLPVVAGALQEQTGFPVVVGPDEALRSRRITLHAAGPVPFWEALDRLGAACGARHDPGAPLSRYPPEPTLVLGPAGGPPAPASDDGPFRVYVVRLSRHREVAAAQPPAETKRRESLSAELQVFAEPGLAMNQTGPVVVEEAIDDRGRDLRVDPPVGSDPGVRTPPRFEEPQSALFSLQIPLKPAAESGGRLRRLKGHVPITVIARTGDPVVVPLAGPEGKTSSKGRVTLGVAGVRHMEKSTSFTLTMRAAQADRRPPAIPLGGYEPPYRIEDHIQVQDDQGRALWWNADAPQDAGGGNLETAITVYVWQGRAPARVLYHDVVGASTKLVFEFHDLPLP